MNIPDLQLHTQSPLVEYLQREGRHLQEQMELRSAGLGKRGGGRPKPIIIRLWRKLNQVGDCYIWTGSTNFYKHGRRGKEQCYGVIGIGLFNPDTIITVHKLAYQLYNGPIPAGFVVRHTCDNSLCANPAHLIVGTQKDNAADSKSRGRNARGETQGSSKLTESQIMEIRTLRKSGMIYKEIAKRFGICTTQAQRIADRLHWAHV